MKLSLTVLALTAHASICAAQIQPPQGLPVVAAKVTSLGTLRDTTGGSLIAQEVSLSPNGSLVAFSMDHGLAIWNVSTRRHHVVALGNTDSPTWSPNGDAIAFHGHDEQGVDQLWMVRVNPTSGAAVGTAQRVGLSAASCCYFPVFSPDGRSIAYARDDGERTSLTIVPTGGGPERVLASGFLIGGFRWSADGASMFYLAYPNSTRANPRLYRVPANGGDSQLLHDFTAESGEPRVSPDGRFAVLPQPGTPREASELLTDLDGTPRARLTFPGDVRIDEREPNAYRVAAVRVSAPTGLRLYDATTGRSRELVDTSTEVMDAAWFADGRRVAMLVRGTAEQTLIVTNVDGSGERRFPITVPAEYSNAGPGGTPALQVSPDGRFALFLGERRRTIEVVDLSTGAERTVARGVDLSFNTPMWTPDSKSIRVIRFDPPPGEWRTVREVSLAGKDSVIRTLPASQYPEVVWGRDANTIAAFGRQSGYTLIHLDGRADQALLRAPTFVMDAGAISPDRKTVAVQVGGSHEVHAITLLSLTDGSRRDVPVSFSNGLKTFDATGHSMLVLGWDTPDGPKSMYSVPLDGGAPRVVARLMTNTAGVLLRWTPDRRSFLYSSSAAATPTISFLMLDWSELATKLPPRQTP